MNIPEVSVIVPTYRHAWELDNMMFSLCKQDDIRYSDYEIIIVNDDPDDHDTIQLAKDYYYAIGHNIRLINVLDAEKVGITNAGRSGNIGARNALGSILILAVDCARIVTPGAISKTLKLFHQFGAHICTTMHPYHIGKHYGDATWTPEQCRKLMIDIKWKEYPYRLFDVAADTRISSTGKINESTFQGIWKKAFMSINGWNESFNTWGSHNLDLWRRCTMPLPNRSTQIVDKPGHWGKVGLGLRVINIDGEGTFHQHHDIFVPRNHANIKSQSAEVWKEYADLGECIVANKNNPNWGRGDIEEISLA